MSGWALETDGSRKAVQSSIGTDNFSAIGRSQDDFGRFSANVNADGSGGNIIVAYHYKVAGDSAKEWLDTAGKMCV